MIGFILGNGRSGTHLLGRLLHGPQAHVCFESKLSDNEVTEHWSWVMAMVRNPTIKDRYWRKLISLYRLLIERYKPKLFIDKSNSLFVYAEDLQQAFPDAYFIGIQRELFPSIRSMANHQGFILDLYYAMGDNVPNMYSGAMHEEFFNLSGLEQLAWRWCAARQQLYYLNKKLDNYLFIDYEGLVSFPGIAKHRIEDFLNFKLPRFEGIDGTKNSGAKEFFSKHEQEIILKAVQKYEELIEEFPKGVKA